MTTSTWISMIAIFAVLVLTSVGRRKLNLIRLLLPLGILAYYGTTYLKNIPTSGNNTLLLIASVVMGMILGGVLLALTKLEYEPGTNRTYVIVGISSVAVWVIAFLMRIIPIEWVTHHTQQSYQFSVQHHFDLNIIGPVFILMTLAMILIRVGGILIRARRKTALQQNS